MKNLPAPSGSTGTNSSLSTSEEKQEGSTPGLAHRSTLSVRQLRRLERALYRLRLEFRSFKSHRYKPFGFAVRAFRLDDTRVVKRGSRVRLTEAITMEFIRKNTNIPVPRVFDVFQYKGSVHILEEYIEGELLVDVWPTLALEARQRCMQQLKGYLEELRSLRPPHPGRIEAVDGSHIQDDKIWRSGTCHFESIEGFNKLLGYDMFANDATRYPEIQEPLKKLQGRKWRTVFSHGDLGPHNMIWRDGRIVSIIDWECAGWLPEYWDYMRTYLGPLHSAPGWWEMYQEIAVQYPDELEVEKCASLYVTRF